MMYSGDEDYGDEITSGLILDEREFEEPGCSNPGGHHWKYTGTAYGGDDTRWCGEGRCYCIHCGTDGDS